MAVVSAASPPVPSDEQLLARSAAGDREALDELLQRYRLIAYRVAYRLLGNETDSLDAVQDGFVKAYRALGRFRRGARILCTPTTPMRACSACESGPRPRVKVASFCLSGFT